MRGTCNLKCSESLSCCVINLKARVLDTVQWHVERKKRKISTFTISNFQLSIKLSINCQLKLSTLNCQLKSKLKFTLGVDILLRSCRRSHLFVTRGLSRHHFRNAFLTLEGNHWKLADLRGRWATSQPANLSLNVSFAGEFPNFLSQRIVFPGRECCCWTEASRRTTIRSVVSSWHAERRTPDIFKSTRAAHASEQRVAIYETEKERENERERERRMQCVRGHTSAWVRARVTERVPRSK